MNGRHGLLTLTLCALAVPALAQNSPGAPGGGIVRGKCTKLVVGGDNLSRQCAGEMASVTLDDGTVMFIFSTPKQMVAFHGDGRRVRPRSDGTAVLPTQFVSAGTVTGRPDVTQATGSCRFADPFAGKPAIIECSAKSRFGAITATFRTNGRPPSMK